MDKNPYNIRPGDIITGYNNGIHEVVSLEEKNGSIEVTYNQVFSIDGRPVAMNRPAVCDIGHCKPALLYIPTVKERIKGLYRLLEFLEKSSGLPVSK